MKGEDLLFQPQRTNDCVAMAVILFLPLLGHSSAICFLPAQLSPVKGHERAFQLLHFCLSPTL